jgi:hypothetical protein
MSQHETNNQNGENTSANAQHDSQETTWSTPRDAVRARTDSSTRPAVEKPTTPRPRALAAAAGAEASAQPAGVAKRIARLAEMIVARNANVAERTPAGI